MAKNSQADPSLEKHLRVRLVRAIPGRFWGKQRFARLFLSDLLSRADVDVKDRHGFRYRVPSVKEPVAFYLLTDGVYEPDLIRFVRERLHPGDTFLDVGANIGAYTLPCARTVGEKGRVIAVEASPRVFEYLRRNVETSGQKNVTLVRRAASFADGQSLDFYEAPPEHFGMGSVGPQFHAVPVRVDSDRLDTILAREGVSSVRVMKVDVEGYEQKVFEGAPRLLSGSDAPVVLFEFVDWAERRAGIEPGSAQKKLLDYGYRLWRFEDLGKKPLSAPMTEGSANLVAVKSA